MRLTPMRSCCSRRAKLATSTTCRPALQPSTVREMMTQRIKNPSIDGRRTIPSWTVGSFSPTSSRRPDLCRKQYLLQRDRLACSGGQSSDVGTSEIISAVAAAAAAAAAVLSGITLWLTGKREKRKWRRESLVDTVVEFLDGSFKRPGNRAYNLLAGGGDPKELQKQAQEGVEQCAAALTRLRLLAPSDMVERAEALQILEDEITESLFEGASPPGVDVWLSKADRRMAARTELLDVARRSLGLGTAKELMPSRHRPRRV